MGELSGITPPSLEWSATDLPTAFKNFQSYCEFVFKGPLASKKPEEKATYLLLWLGQEGINIFQTWNLSAEDQKDPAKIFERYKKHFEPKTNYRLSRFQLQKMGQIGTENADEFMTRCRIQADKCKFSDTELESRLIEQIIIGTAHKKVQENLLSKDDKLTLDAAMDYARTHEATKAHMQALNATTELSVDAIYRRGHGRKQKPKGNNNYDSNNTKNDKCGLCGLKYPHKGACPAEGTTCNYCSGENHWETMCRKKKRDNRGRSQEGGQRQGNGNRPNSRNRQQSRTHTQSQGTGRHVDNITNTTNNPTDNDSDDGSVSNPMRFDSIYIHNVNGKSTEHVDEIYAEVDIHAGQSATCNPQSQGRHGGQGERTTLAHLL